MSTGKQKTGAKLIALAATFLFTGGAAQATSSETAENLCVAEMKDINNALAIRDLKVRRHDDVPYVYGNADFDDLTNVHFRCEVRRDTLQEVRYLVPDPEWVDGRMWVLDRPEGDSHQGFVLDEPAMSAPPPVSSGPHFIRVPQSN